MKQYINEKENLFYTWAKDVVQDAGLAEKLSHVHTKSEILEAFE